MKRFFKRLGFIIFFQLLFFLTVFYIEKQYYPQWTISFLIMFILLIALSFRVIGSAKNEEELAAAISDQMGMLKILEDIRAESLKLPYICPGCNEENTYWSFLEDYKCRKCGSELWTVKLKEYDEVYDKIFKKREKVYNFYSRLPSRIAKKIKHTKTAGLSE